MRSAANLRSPHALLYTLRIEALDIFVVVSGRFSILASMPLIYLAYHSYRDGRELRRIQLEVAELMSEVREIQHEIHHD